MRRASVREYELKQIAEKFNGNKYLFKFEQFAGNQISPKERRKSEREQKQRRDSAHNEIMERVRKSILETKSMTHNSDKPV